MPGKGLPSIYKMIYMEHDQGVQIFCIYDIGTLTPNKMANNKQGKYWMVIHNNPVLTEIQLMQRLDDYSFEYAFQLENVSTEHFHMFQISPTSCGSKMIKDVVKGCWLERESYENLGVCTE